MKRLLLLISLVYGLTFLGLAALKGSALALVIPFVIYLGAGLLYGPDAIRLTATRTVSADRVTQDQPVVVKVSITNAGSRLEEVQLEDLVSRPIELIAGTTRLLTSIRPGATVDIEYTLRAKRGTYRFQGVRVMASDHLGLFWRQAMLTAPARLLVTPEILKLRRVPIRPRRTRVYSGFIPARQGGPGVEFFGVREYQTGDPLRWINWRISARYPEAYFTTEFEQERVADVALILDARLRNDIQSKDGSLFEYAAQAAANLAEAFLNDGNRVGLLVYGSFLDWTLPAYGKMQRERILQALARAEPGESMIFEKLDLLPTRLFPPQSQIVLISPLLKDDLPMLIRLRARRYQLLVISPDPIPLEVEALGPRPEVKLAARIARLERVLLIHQLRQAGAYVLDWRVDTPFDQAVHAALGRPLPRYYHG
ncbi:MAG: DUF58 domain-containing protein [Anaerolineae bacterium]